MENQTEQTYLAQEKLGRLMRKYAVPCMVSLLVAALYNIVDQIFYCKLPAIWDLTETPPMRWYSR